MIAYVELLEVFYDPQRHLQGVLKHFLSQAREYSLQNTAEKIKAIVLEERSPFISDYYSRTRAQ